MTTTDIYLYNTTAHPKGSAPRPTFVIRGGRVFTTAWHSDGEDPHPWYEVRDDRLYPTDQHPQRAPRNHPWYSIRGKDVFADEGHPHGAQKPAWFELRPLDTPAATGGETHG